MPNAVLSPARFQSLLEFETFFDTHSFPNLRVSLMHNLLKGLDGLEKVSPDTKASFFLRKAEEVWKREVQRYKSEEGTDDTENQLVCTAIQFAMSAAWDDEDRRYIITTHELHRIFELLVDERLYSYRWEGCKLDKEPYQRHVEEFLRLSFYWFRRNSMKGTEPRGPLPDSWFEAVVASGNTQLFSNLCPQEPKGVQCLQNKLKEKNKPVVIGKNEIRGQDPLSHYLKGVGNQGRPMNIRNKWAEALVLQAGRCGLFDEVISLKFEEQG